MMYELFVLGELMEGRQSGYRLRKLLQITLGRHRKISFGVIYPLLDKLEDAGYIELSEESGGRSKNTASITERGKERFFELMAQPVPPGAHSDDIYIIKLDVMQHLPRARRLELLASFEAEQRLTLDDTRRHIAKLGGQTCIDHWYAQKKLELRLAQTESALAWAETFRAEIGKMEGKP